jgi:4-diphosphocytidyl-2-C-methyl-D-erythritol kinase
VTAGGPAHGLAVRCPAKINTRLVVVSRRDDGYHELDTTFVELDLHDTLELRRAGSFTLVVDSERDREVPVAGNLVLRAAEILAREAGAGRVPGAAMTLRKRIPVAAGLGGGSSDAAGVLLGVPALHGFELPPPDLEAMALEVGSDVPYFLRGGRQRGQGRGERLTPLRFEGQESVLLVRPRLALATRAVFEAHARRSLTSRKTEASFWMEAENGGREPIRNDLWQAAAELAPELPTLLEALRNAFPEERTGLSGSGPTLFVLSSDPDGEGLARRARRVLPPGVEVLPTRTAPPGDVTSRLVPLAG